MCPSSKECEPSPVQSHGTPRRLPSGWKTLEAQMLSVKTWRTKPGPMPLLLFSSQPLKLIYAQQKKKSLKWLRNSHGQPKTSPFTSLNQSWPAHTLWGLAEWRARAPPVPWITLPQGPWGEIIPPSSWKASIRNSSSPLHSAWQGSARPLEAWQGLTTPVGAVQAHFSLTLHALLPDFLSHLLFHHT